MILASVLLNRWSQPTICNSNSSISKLNIFSEGKLRSVPNCSMANIFNREVWSSDEFEMVTLAQQIETLEEPIILTLDLQHPKKLKSVLNYYWVGAKFIYTSSQLSTWLGERSYAKYKSQSEDPSISRILNSLTNRINHSEIKLYNWSTHMNISRLRLKDVLLTREDYCNKFLINLDFLEQCKSTFTNNIEHLFSGAIELLISQLLLDYYQGISFSKKLKFLTNIKENRRYVSGNLNLKSKKWLGSYADLKLHIHLVVKGLISEIMSNAKVDADLLAKVCRESMNLDSTNYLVVSKEPLGVVSIRGEKNYSSINVNPDGFIFSKFGSLLPLSIGDIYFDKQLFIGNNLNLNYSILSNSRFVYLFKHYVDISLINKIGLSAYLFNNKKVKFIKLHPASLKLAKVNQVNFNDTKALQEALGWEGTPWSAKEASYVPQANIDGILKFRF